jgi:HSP90 family molecular chaperone
LASYLDHVEELKLIEGEKFQLEVKIEIDEAENKVVIRDNAAGIYAKDYPRAFRAAEVL